MYFSSITTAILISEVEIIWMLMPSSASDLSHQWKMARSASPACDFRRTTLSQSGRRTLHEPPWLFTTQAPTYAAPWTIDANVTALAGLIESEADGPVVVVGHSFGGGVAMQLAYQHPECCERLVLVAPAGFERFGRGEGSWLAEAVDKEFVAKTPPEAVYANVAANFYSMPKEARFMVSSIVFTSPKLDGMYVDPRSAPVDRLASV